MRFDRYLMKDILTYVRIAILKSYETFRNYIQDSPYWECHDCCHTAVNLLDGSELHWYTEPMLCDVQGYHQ